MVLINYFTYVTKYRGNFKIWHSIKYTEKIKEEAHLRFKIVWILNGSKSLDLDTILYSDNLKY